jgi:hypothetical protein
MKRLMTLAVALATSVSLSLVSTPGATASTRGVFQAKAGDAIDTGYTYDLIRGKTTDPAAAAKLKAVTKDLPAGWMKRVRAERKRFGIDPNAMRLLQNVINPDDYVCEPTDFDPWLDSTLEGVNVDNLFVLLMIGALDIPTYDALLYGTKNDPSYALRADRRGVLKRDFRAIKGFWDIKSGDIQLMGMHGEMLLQNRRVKRVYREVFELPKTEAKQLAKAVRELVLADPALDRGAHPLFTLNAFAFSAEGDPDPLVAGVPDKLVFGDGIIDALIGMRVGKVGPRAVLGHEFGHHIQFERNLFESDLEGAEATRRTELMADAFGTYFVTHKRGLALNRARVTEAEKTFYEVGDCAFDDPGHHGTPNQRTKAAQWGAKVARWKKQRTKIFRSQVFAKMFDGYLPTIVAPDAP